MFLLGTGGPIFFLGGGFGGDLERGDLLRGGTGGGIFKGCEVESEGKEKFVTPKEVDIALDVVKKVVGLRGFEIGSLIVLRKGNGSDLTKVFETTITSPLLLL